MQRLVLATVIALGATTAPAKKRPRRPATVAPAVPAPPALPPTNDTPVPPDGSARSPADEASAPSPAPAAAPAAPPPVTRQEPAAASKEIDLEALSAEYNQLRDELFRSRAKADLLGDALFKTKIATSFRYQAQRAWPLKRVTLRIDEQPVFSADSPTTNDPLQLYDGFVAPGRHTLSLKVECGATGESRVAYGAEGTFVIDIAEQKITRVNFVVDESGDGPEKLAKKRHGSFDVRVRADVETLDRSTAPRATGEAK
jgi:hypothetical protein